MSKLKFLASLSFVFLLSTISFLLSTIFSSPVSAATLTGAKDTITTSRPSPSSPLSANAASGATQVSIYDNKSIFLASDTAKLIRTSTGAVIDASIVVASQSAARTTTYFAEGTGAAAQNGTDVLIFPITAKHTITFITANPVPNLGDIEITFPGSADNTASPSASTFAFNGLAAGNVTLSATGVSASTPTISSPNISINIDTGSIAAGVTVTVTIGSSTPALINPTADATIGTGDYWTVTAKSEDASNVEIDSVKMRIATIESVIVYATVDPTLTFTITGINTATAINTANTTGCTNTETTNSGFNSSATEVNLGVLGSGAINIAAQRINITTNGIGGYSLTATSSGKLIDPASGYEIVNAQGNVTANDTPVPVVLTAGTVAFGIHSCGLDVTGGTWGTGATGGGAGAKYANPSPAYYYTLASDTSGPVDNSLTTGNGITSVEYASTISAAVPAGSYRTVLTYVATATF